MGDVSSNAPDNLGEGTPLHLPGPEVEGDLTRWDLRWQACPTCQRLTIGQSNTMSCRDCAAELGAPVQDALVQDALVQDALDDVWSIPEFDKVIDIVPAMVEGAVGTEFFMSGHRMPQLQEAYAKARGMRFEGKERRKSA